MEERKLITDKKEIKKMVDSYFNSRLKSRITKGLTSLSEKNGVIDDYLCFLFKHNLDEYDISMLQQPMTDKHILISFDYPASEEDCEAYVTFEEFYEYLEKAIQRVINRCYLTAEGDELYEAFQINQLLEKVKIALEISF